MKLRLFSLFLVAITIASCSKSKDNVLTTSSTEASKFGAGKSVGKPFSGSILYHFSSAFDLSCNCQTYYPAGNFYGTGNLTHLGLSSSKIKPCVAPIYSGGVYIGNHVGVECASFVAADGDELYLSIHPYDILFTAAGPVGIATVDFAGGTGKFSSATGSFTGTVSILSATDASLTVISGTIIY